MLSLFTSNEDILFFKLIKPEAFKTHFKALKDKFVETNIVFSQEGMHILNSYDKMMIDLKIPANEFHDYKCETRILIGVNLEVFLKMLTTSAGEILSISIKRSDYINGIIQKINLKSEDEKKKIIRNETMQIIDVQDECLEYKYTELNYQTIINLPIKVFSNIIQRMHDIHKIDVIDIQTFENKIIFKGRTFSTSYETQLTENENVKFNQSNHQVIQGNFSVKKMLFFVKCASISETVQLYLDNNLPLMVEYKSLGTLRLSLEPVN
jgi:proliferating cell nuclear antigen